MVTLLDDIKLVAIGTKVPFVGQASSLQVPLCELVPTQFEPPLLGVGVSHTLVLVLVPLSQVCVHTPQVCHSLHPASVTIECRIQYELGP